MTGSGRSASSARAAIAVVLGLGIGLRLFALGNVPVRGPDERTYAYQANRILDGGVGGLRSVVEEFRRDPAAKLYPFPSRAGYLWLVAAAMKLTGTRDARAGAYLSCAASIGSLLLVALIGARFFPPGAAVTALLFMAVFPAELAVARRAWGDALLGFLALAMIVPAAEITRGGRSRALYLMFVGAGCLAITVKETGSIAFGLCLLWVSWVLFVEERAWREGLLLGLLAGAGSAAAVSWQAFSVGGFRILLEMMTILPKANAANAYALEYQTGPWYQVLEGFFIVAPLLALSCVAGVAAAVFSRAAGRAPCCADGRPDTRVAAGIAFVLVSFLAVPMVLPHWVNLRYLAVVFGPLCLLAGLGFWCAVRVLAARLPAIRPRVVAATACAVVLAGAAVDCQYFQSVVLRQALPDLSIKMLHDAGRGKRVDAARPNPVGSTAPAASPEEHLNLSLRLHRQGRYRESIAASLEALKRRPDFPEAYNNIAAAYESLGLWDEAILAAEQALRLRPDFELARNNLRYSLEQKRLRQGVPAAAR
jgi:4-amino-4-deoxy-L-arabinose transferase-like glycosyltransferase